MQPQNSSLAGRQNEDAHAQAPYPKTSSGWDCLATEPFAGFLFCFRESNAIMMPPYSRTRLTPIPERRV
jgi:hypothetical protein